MNNIIDLKINKKEFRKNNLSILNDIELIVSAGERIAIVGKSGVGKSSLLNILGLIDCKYDGEYHLFGRSTKELSDKDKAIIRNKDIGFVLQDSALIESMTIRDNILLPLMYTDKETKKKVLNNFDYLIYNLDIKSILDKKPSSCSGGERSRAVFARGVIMNPRIILADEPTASLDGENKDNIVNLLFEMNNKSNTTLIVVTHDMDIANKFDRIVYISR